jgi:glycerophosphoryl diester phosphodiesterase
MNAFKSEVFQKFIENEFTIIDKERNEVPFILNKAQADFIQNLSNLNNVLKNRKQGISSVSLAIAVTKFLMGKNERCVSVSFIESSAFQQLERAKHFLKSYQATNGVKVPLKYDSKQQWVYEGVDEQGRPFINSLRVGSAKSKSFGRGDDITFLHITEAAHADDLEALLSGIGEAVTNDAITILETTANGFDQFKTHWDNTEKGMNTYKNFFYDPFWTYSKEFVEEKRRNLGRLGAQEYPYTAKEAFLTSGLPYFEHEPMMEYEQRVQSSKPLKDQWLSRDMFSQYRTLQKGEFIIVFVDTAGEGSDWNSAQFLSKDRLDIPIVLHHEGSIIDVTPKLKDALEWIFKETGVKPVVCYETNNGGGYELERLNRLNLLQHYIVYKQYALNPKTKQLEKTDKLGWNTNSATRPVMLQGVEDLVNNRLVTIYHPVTVTQMFSFVKHKTPAGWKAEAETGAHDDEIMSLAGVWQLYQTEVPIVPRKTNRPKPKRSTFHV